MSKVIKILGTGCSKCKTTTAVVTEVVNELGINVEIIKVEDITEIMGYNVMSTPAVVINEKVMIKGRVPSKKEVKEILTNL